MTQLAIHSPGPWLVEKPSRGWGDEWHVTTGPPVGGLIATVNPTQYFPDNIAEAHARLIAAAPELLEAAKAITAYQRGDWGSISATASLEFEESLSTAARAFELVVNKALAAIAKATGAS